MSHTPRLAADLWVSQLLRRCGAAGVGAQIIHKGDPTAGAVLVKLVLGNFGANVMIFERAWLENGQRGWRPATGTEPVPEFEGDDFIARQRRYDGDLWVVEIEDPKARPWWAEECPPTP